MPRIYVKEIKLCLRRALICSGVTSGAEGRGRTAPGYTIQGVTP